MGGLSGFAQTAGDALGADYSPCPVCGETLREVGDRRRGIIQMPANML